MTISLEQALKEFPTCPICGLEVIFSDKFAGWGCSVGSHFYLSRYKNGADVEYYGGFKVIAYSFEGVVNIVDPNDTELCLSNQDILFWIPLLKDKTALKAYIDKLFLLA